MIPDIFSDEIYGNQFTDFTEWPSDKPMDAQVSAEYFLFMCFKDTVLRMMAKWYITKKHADQPKSYFWKPTEVSRLKILYTKGIPMRQIAEKMGRSYSSIRNKVGALQKEGFRI